MKKLINNRFVQVAGLIILVVVSVATIILLQDNSENISQSQNQTIVVEPAEYDWGDIELDSLAEQEVTVSNTGNDSVQILRISTSCSCTTAEVTSGETSPFSLNAGESKQIKVIFDPSFHEDQPLGEITREIYIRTDHDEQQELVVRFIGNIVNTANTGN